MASNTVAQFAAELHLAPNRLLEQLRAAGVMKSSDNDNLTEEDKTRLLESLRRAGGRLLPRGSEFVAAKIALRSASADSVAVIERDSGEMLGLVESERTFTTVHPGAVYLHLGRSYEVEQLDVDGRRGGRW